MTFSQETYVQRRNDLKDKMGTGILLFLGNNESPMNYTDNCYPFRQDSNFLYFFGIDQPGLNAVIDLDNNKEIIFGDELTTQDIVWTGPQPSLKDLSTQVGIKEVRPSKSLIDFLLNSHKSRREVHYLPPYRGENVIRIAEGLGISSKKVRQLASEDFVKAVVALRSYKSSEEVDEMTKAVNTSRKIHLKAREMSRSGVVESQICGALHEIAIADGGMLAYPAIITVNGQTLHNHHYGNTLQNGQLLLADVGAESSSHYAGDITRTFPVDGKFSSQQKEIYSSVLNAEKNAIDRCKPGVLYRDVHHLAMVDLANSLKDLGLMKGDIEEAVTAGAHAMFCPHGLGHMIGLDVHDMEDLGEDLVGYDSTVKRSDQFGTKALRLGKALEDGFVLTVEPGLYFIPELIDIWRAEDKFVDFINYDAVSKFVGLGGARIEDNVLITSDGNRVIGDPIPKEVAEVEF